MSLAKLAITKLDVSLSDASADYGGAVNLLARIYNNTDSEVIIERNNVCLYIPEKLIVKSNKARPYCVFPDNPDTKITVQPNSEYTFTWGGASSEFISGNVLFEGISFKPDTYIYVLNIIMEYVDKTDKNPVNASVPVTRDVRMHVELPRYAVWVYSIIGMIIMNIGWVGYQWIKYAAKFGNKFIFEDIPERRHMLSTFIGNTVYGLPISSVLVLVTLASHKAGRVISINILDFYGAIVAGIVAQLLVITRRHEKHLDN